jgi:hypothetical protein
MRLKRGGQSMLEYSILICIIIAAFITMQIYIKRGFQGRWKSAVDELGDQYDPNKTNSVFTYRMTQTGETSISTVKGSLGGTDGYYTIRKDSSNMEENREGNLRIEY